MLVGVLHAAKARKAESEVAAAIAQFIDEGLICATKLHVLLLIFWEELSWVFCGHLRNLVEFDSVDRGASWLVDRSHLMIISFKMEN